MAYIGTQPVPRATQTRESFTATSGQDTFATRGYTPNFLDVYLNGVKLDPADFTATNGSDVVLASPASADDVVNIVAYRTFTTASLSDGSVGTDEIADGAVTSAKIVDDAVTSAKIADGAVTSAKIAAGAAVPDQTGHAGQFLTTDGTNADWATVDEVPSQTGHSGKYLTTDGSTASWGTITDPTPAAVSDVDNTSTGFFDLPSGTDAQRPSSSSNGYIRYNSESDRFEGYEDGEWRRFTTEGTYSTVDLFYDFDPADLTYSDNTTINSGTAITDRSSNLTTTVRGSNLVFRTSAGGHLDTNNANGYLNTTDSGSFSQLSSATSISVVLWFQSNGASRQVLIARYGTGWPNQFNHIVDPTGDFHFNSTGAISGASGNLDSSSNWWENNTWHHTAWVYSVSDGIMRWYIDGAQVVTFNAGTDSGNGLSVSSTANFSIGSRSDDLERLNGKIGPVRVYTRALTALEIAEDWTNTRTRFGV